MSNTVYPFLAACLFLVFAGCGSDTEVSLSETEAPDSATSEPTRAPMKKLEPLPIPDFMQAALDGDAVTIGDALSSGTGVNTVDEDNRTALMLASFNGHSKVASLLLDAGAQVNWRDSMGRTALMFASTGPHSETVKLLLEHKAEVNLVDGDEHWTALMFAAAEGHEDVVRLLLKHGANPHLKDTDGDTAGSFAAKNGNMTIADLLKRLVAEGKE